MKALLLVISVFGLTCCLLSIAFLWAAGNVVGSLVFVGFGAWNFQNFRKDLN